MSVAAKKFSRNWKSSSKPKKQRKYRLHAPLHIRQALMHVHLSKELRKKYSHRNIGVRVGDKVKVMRGSFKKQEGKVESVNRKKSRVFITGIERTKRDGAKVKIGIHTSKLLITELNLDDKYRQEILKRGTA